MQNLYFDSGHEEPSAIRGRKDGVSSDWYTRTRSGYTRLSTHTESSVIAATEAYIHRGSLDPLDRQLGARLSPIKTDLFALSTGVEGTRRLAVLCIESTPIQIA